MMTPMQQAPSFEAWAGEYDRYRPGYPDELFAGELGELVDRHASEGAALEVPYIVDCWTARRNEA